MNEDQEDILNEIGWDFLNMARPLEGLKILDFTHVLAGPFATRMLGDMGADVVKINSLDRAVGANDPIHPYYIMWNRNKGPLRWT